MISLTSSYDHKQRFNHTLNNNFARRRTSYLYYSRNEVQIYLLFKLGTSRNLDLVLLLLFSKELSLQALQHKENASREKVWKKRVPIPPAWKSKSSSTLSWTSLPLFICLSRDRVEDKVVTTEGVSCITTQTTQTLRNFFFGHLQDEHVGWKKIVVCVGCTCGF